MEIQQYLNRDAVFGQYLASATFLGMSAGSTSANVKAADEGCTSQRNSPITVTKLSCASSVTRGGSATCTVTPSGVTVSGWTFKDGSGNTVSRTTNATSLTWSGVMVSSGTVSVTATVSGFASLLTASISLNNRSWHTNPGSAVPVPNGTFYHLPVPPQPTGDDAGLGEYKESTSNSSGPNSTIISDNGPNNGYAYFATQLNISTLFQYEINPDLASSTSQFSTHQWGACGYISWSNLLAQTNRHEFNSFTQSHYAFYTASINSGVSNPGEFFEQQVAPPGANLQQFVDTTTSGLTSRYSQITAATAVQPFPVNYSEAGTFLGNINYAPYASCP